MAIALVVDSGTAEWTSDPFDAPWPRPRPPLEVLPGVDDVGGWDRGTGRDGAARASARGVPRVVGSTPVRTGEDVAGRRARRAIIRRRRRCLVLSALAACLGCGLALPLGALGGSATPPRSGKDVAVIGETVYVVRPGDTLWSIAARFDRTGNPRPMAEALARETGSAVVVAGERIVIP